MTATGLELVTEMKTEEIEKMTKAVKAGKINPKEAKMRLAKEVTAIYHGTKKAAEAVIEWKKVFSKREIPEKMEEVKLDRPQRDLVWLIVKINKTSKSNAWRLIKQGGVKIDGEKGEVNTQLTGGEIIKVGRKNKYIKIKSL